MRSVNINVKFFLVVALVAMTLFAIKPTSTASAAGPMVCFPSCAENDGRMLSLSGGGLSTFVGGTIEIGFTSPAGAPTVVVGVFDPGSQGLWDSPTVDLKFELVADPGNDGTGTIVLATHLGSAAPAGSDENAWWDNTFPNMAVAMGTGGKYSYFLRISPVTPPADGSLNGIKVRTDGTFSLTGQTMQFVAKADTMEEFAIIGGIDKNTYQCPTPTTYDGTWEFEFEVKPNTIALELWDGDLDVGNMDAADTANKDTDDPNTPSTNVCVDPDPTTLPNCTNPNVPLWSQSASTQPEGVAEDGNGPGVGDPADDNTELCAFLRSPGVTYRLLPPGADANDPKAGFKNSNPSGTSEWEKFLISTNAGDNPDHVVAAIQPGTWKLRIEGMDVSNQFALHFNRSLAPTVSRGCGPGYWKQSQHFGSYPDNVTPNTPFSDVFSDAFPGKTVLDVLNQNGGGLNALGRIIVGAYLSASTVPGYTPNKATVVSDFNKVYPGGDYNALKSKYEALQVPCPFDRNPGN